ncbi:MAG: hypothetical protein HY254_08210 [Burkholderiales bacterium]|nr:hypothetical protein [Burkholderiales bacterium]
MPNSLKKPSVSLTAIALYVFALCCFLLPLVFPALQFDGGFGYMLALYYLCGIIFSLAGIFFHLWIKSRNAAGHTQFLERAEKEAVPHRLGENEEWNQ